LNQVLVFDIIIVLFGKGIKVKLLDFDYIKKTGESSTRTLAVVQEPQRFIEGIDVTELDHESFAEFVNQYSKLLDEYKYLQAELINKYDLKHNYRRFTPENMTNVVVEYV
jgi:hypothetical protein